MYKVFVNDCLICLSDTYNILPEGEIQNFDQKFMIQQITELERSEAKQMYFYCENLEKSWKEFRSILRIETAAGGKVYNSDNEILFIKRFGKWDLPKGHVEEGESYEIGAMREVEEECGVSNLKILKKLPTTYHIFRRKSVLTLKETFWFEMETSSYGTLKPQLEEDITEVHFFDAVETQKALENTYENIRLLFEE